MNRLRIALLVLTFTPGIGLSIETCPLARSQQAAANQGGEQPKRNASGVERATPEDLSRVPDGTQKYAILVTAPAGPVRYGERFVLPVVLINISDAPVRLYIPFVEYEPEVRDADGKLLRPTFVPYEGPQTGTLWDIQPGDKLSTGDVLPKYYRDAMKPGTYSIRLTLDRVDWSNKITVTVVP